MDFFDLIGDDEFMTEIIDASFQLQDAILHGVFHLVEIHQGRRLEIEDKTAPSMEEHTGKESS